MSLLTGVLRESGVWTGWRVRPELAQETPRGHVYSQGTSVPREALLGVPRGMYPAL